MHIHELYQAFKQSTGIVTDSRKVKTGCIFAAINGENVDGNQFADSALKNGARLAIIDNKKYAGSQKALVSDTIDTLQNLAKIHRQSWSIPVIGIGGSNGKTTTKELLTAILQKDYKIGYTKGNLNNHIGLPLTILDINPGKHTIAILEIGANHAGENAFLSEIASPTHVLVTNNGKDHLEGFGSEAGVRKANAELFDYARKHQASVFVDAAQADLMKDSIKINRITFGCKENADLKICNIEAGSIAGVMYDGQSIVSKLAGNFNWKNIAAAIAIGHFFNVDTGSIKKAIEEYEPTNRRSQILKWNGAQVLFDAYNANPTSMHLALESFLESFPPPHVLIVGEMREMGKYSQVEHTYLLEKLLQSNAKIIITVGKEFPKMEQPPSNIHQFISVEEAKRFVSQLDCNDTSIFVKGSRGVTLEKLFE